jgi:hypothetical protein
MSRPQRARKPTKIKKAADDTEELARQICDLKVAKKRRKTALQPIALKSTTIENANSQRPVTADGITPFILSLKALRNRNIHVVDEYLYHGLL